MDMKGMFLLEKVMGRDRFVQAGERLFTWLAVHGVSDKNNLQDLTQFADKDPEALLILYMQGLEAIGAEVA